MVRKLLFLVLAATALLGAVVLFKTLRYQAPPVGKADEPTAKLVFPVGAITHLQQAVRYQTVSYDTTTAPDSAQFLGFHRHLRRTYPLLHARLQRQLVGGYTLVYKWVGTEEADAPAILLAHYDVVPVDPATRAQWTYAPFLGQVHAGRIWGRGTTDNKANLTALLEATEQLLREGFQPKRTLYFVFGHDEELGGGHGARLVARQLAREGVRPACVLDEGGMVTTERVPGMVGRPVALVGTAEKGYLSLQLRAEVPGGGHSSLPEPVTALDLLTQALVTLRQHPFPAAFTPSMQDFAAQIGPHLPFLQRMAFANAWLFQPLILKTYQKTASGAAAVRTTLVPTIVQAGLKDNVVPTVATATINLRLLPGTSSAQALALVRQLLPDQRISIKPVGMIAEASLPAPTNALGYLLIKKQIHRHIPGALVTPFLFVAQSDSRHFLSLTASIYRFSPLTNPSGFHGINESLSLASYRQCYGFYHDLIQQMP